MTCLSEIVLKKSLYLDVALFDQLADEKAFDRHLLGFTSTS